jgi:WD40 repeat protein
MPDLRDLFSRAIGETPGFDAVAVRRVVARRRRRRLIGAAAFVVVVVATGSALAVSSRHHDRQVFIAPPDGGTTSTSAGTTSTTGPSGRLGYPTFDTHPDAFRGFGRLAYPSEGGLVILDGTGGAPRSVSFPAPVDRVRWSPDGEWLAVHIHSDSYAASGQSALFALRADSTTPVRMPVSAAAADWEWSPTHDVLAVVDQPAAARNGSITVFAAPDFTAPVSTPIPAEFPVGFLAWSPDGSRLFFKSYSLDGSFVDRLWSVDEQRCPPTCSPAPTEFPTGIAADANSDVGLVFAGWSGDATRLLLWLDIAHSGSVMMDGLAVASITVDGRAKAELPRMLAKPSWVATVLGTNRAIIAVGGFRTWDSHRQLDSCDLETGACTPLVVNPGPTIDPAVSPDGRRLAYVATDKIVFANNDELPPKSSIRWSRSRRLVVAGLENQDPKIIATDGVVAPRWAADGRHLVYWRAGYLWLVDADNPAPIAIAGQLAPRPADFGETFEENPYILPGDDVWDTVAWLR